MSEVTKVYRVPEACDLIGCRKTKLYQLISQGLLDARKSGATTVIMAQSIQSYLSSLPPADICLGRRKPT